MPSRKYTQGVAVLVRAEPDLSALRRVLSSFDIVSELGAKLPTEARPWDDGYPTLVIGYRPEVNGHVLVDVVPAPWPDAMASRATDPDLFDAWTSGALGPCVFPGNLERAVQFARHWEDAGEEISAHRAFVRIRSTYAHGRGAASHASALPKDYDALAELRFVSSVARAVLDVDGALALFNPSGETIHSAESYDTLLEIHEDGGYVPYMLWSQVRLLALDGVGSWEAMDTVGLGQLGMADHEVCFRRGKYEPNEIEFFLRDVAEQIRERGKLWDDGVGVPGPGKKMWQCVSFESSLVIPPRGVVRWLPMDRRDGLVDIDAVPKLFVEDREDREARLARERAKR